MSKYHSLLKLCEDKDIALVGNAGGLIAEFGQIDKHEVVIRLNAGVFMPDPAVRGSKLHAVFFSITGCEEEIRKKNVPAFMVSPIGIYSDEAKKQFVGLEVEDWETFRKKILIDRPTTGILTLLWILEFGKPKKLTLYGFDGFKTGNFYSNRPASDSPHNMRAENEYITRLFSAGVIDMVPVAQIEARNKGFLKKTYRYLVLAFRRGLIGFKIRMAARSTNKIARGKN